MFTKSRNLYQVTMTLNRNEWLRVMLVLSAYGSLGGSDSNHLLTIHSKLRDQLKKWDDKFDEEHPNI